MVLDFLVELEYFENGRLKKATFTSSLNATYSKEELFMRGLKPFVKNQESRK